MGYDARASNGERPQHVTDRRFRFDAAVAINHQATAINQALSTTRTHQELLTQLAADYLRLRKDHDILADRLYTFVARSFRQRVWWLLSGR